MHDKSNQQAHNVPFNREQQLRSKQKHRERQEEQRRKREKAEQIACLTGSNQTIHAWGDDMQVQSEHFRVLYNNCNGIPAEDNFVKCHDIGDGVNQMNVDVLGLAETCLDWSNAETTNTCRDILRKHCKVVKSNQSSSDRTFDTRYQPGGTMTMIRGKWAGRTTAEGNDAGMGRWSELRMQGREGRKLRLITAYRVCNQNALTAGFMTATRQQYEILKDRKVREPNPRKQVLADLEQRVREIVSSGEEVLMMMDANESLCNSQGELTKWVKRLELVDVIGERHGSKDEPGTHTRGTERIDHIFCTSLLSEFVTASGVLEFEALTNSDHRPVYVDLDMNAFMGGEPSPLESYSQRGIMSNDPRAVALYREVLLMGLVDSDLEAEFDALLESIEENGGAFDELLHGSEADRLEAMFSKIKADAEKACQRIQSYPWSPKLRKARIMVRYWSMWITQLRCGVDLTEKRTKLNETLETSQSDPTIQYAQTQLRKVRKELKLVLRSATALRIEHLEERARMVANDGLDTEATAIAKIMRAEQQRSMWARLRRGLGKAGKGGLTHILVEKDDGTTECITDRAEMDARLIKRNIDHFSQADGTPFTESPLIDILGRHGTTEAAKWILDGEYDGEIDDMPVTEATKSILRRLRRVVPEGTICDHITSDDLRQGYAKWRESTSTSPSGLHLGHEKALLRMENDETVDMFGRQLSERVFELKAKFLNLAIQHCHVYKRWTKIVNATIEKIQGRPLLHKLRVIHLIESDFNLLIGILWARRLMKLGEENESFGTDQYGCRKGKSAIGLVVGKQAKLSAIRLAVASCCFLENDAKSCFDRIVMLLVSMISQKEGMSPAACKLFLSTLDKVKYHVKTQLGISDECYGTTKERTVHGPGQGGKGSPTVWVLISCLIMECLRDISGGLSMHGTNGTCMGTTFTTGFVDDITLWMGDMLRSLDNEAEPKELLDDMSAAAQRWEELLFSTGGKLELSKCFFYLMSWKFNEDGIPVLLEPHELPSSIHIRDSGSQEMMDLATRSCGEAYKTLGVMECPSGDYSAETKRLKDKANDFARKVSTMAIRRHDAWALYHQMIMPSMLYSATVGTLTRKDADTISNKLKHAILSSMGYNCHMPLAVVYGSTKLGGLGMTHMFAAQGAAKAMAILKYVRCGNEIGQDILCAYQWAQRVAGVAKQVLEDPAARIPHLDGEIGIQTLREFLALSKMEIVIPEIKTITIKREKDQVLMSAFLTNVPKAANSVFCLANRCRLYLQVETIADICNENGTEVTTRAWNCTEGAMILTDELWPTQPRPGRKCIRAWQTLLKKLCRDKNLILRQPLGAWIKSPSRCHWAALYNTQRNTVFAIDRETTLYTEYAMEPAERRKCTIGTALPDQIPKSWEDIIAHVQNDRHCVPAQMWIMPHGPNEIVIPTAPKIPAAAPIRTPGGNTWTSFIATTDKFTQDLLSGCDTNEDDQDSSTLVEKLMDPTVHLYIVSDGGCRNLIGSYGFVMADAQSGQRVWAATGRVQGFGMTSYRAEAHGMLAALTFLSIFTEYHCNGAALCKTTHFCDNESLVTETAWDRTWTDVTDSTKPEFDLLRAITETRTALSAHFPGQQRNRWVKGHQETTIPWDKLAIQAQLNVEADALATDTILRALKKDKVLRVIPSVHCRAYLLNAGQIQTRDEVDTLQTKWRDHILLDHYKTRLKVTPDTLRNINWEGLKMARNKLDTNERIYANKLQAGWLKSGTRAAKEHELVVECHRCGNEETNDHVMQCRGCATRHVGTLAAFQEFLTKLDTCSEISHPLCRGLEAWLTTRFTAKYDKPEHDTDTNEKARKSQEAIGWGCAMKGLLSTEWAKIHASKTASATHTPPDDMQGKVWSSQVSMWLIRECRTYWTDRNNTRQESTSPEEPTKSRAEAEAEAQVTLLYSRQMEIAQEDRALFFHVPLERRLMLPTKRLLQWAKDTRAQVNRMASKHAELERHNQPDIRRAIQPTEAEKAIKHRQNVRRLLRTKPHRAASTRTRPATETAQLRAAQPKMSMIDRLKAGQKAARKREKEAAVAKAEAVAAQISKAEQVAVTKAVKLADKAARAAAKAKKKREGTTTRQPHMNSHAARQIHIRPHTQTLVEHERKKRRGPKMKDTQGVVVEWTSTTQPYTGNNYHGIQFPTETASPW